MYPQPSHNMCSPNRYCKPHELVSHKILKKDMREKNYLPAQEYVDVLFPDEPVNEKEKAAFASEAPLVKRYDEVDDVKEAE